MGYQKNHLPKWVDAASRQAAKDEILFKGLLVPYLLPGRTLELGGGVGQLALLLHTLGYSVIGSDLEPFFVDFQCSLGLHAIVVDATNLDNGSIGPMENIMAQGLSPLICDDWKVVARCYASIYAALARPGRFLFIHGGLKNWPASREYARLLDGHCSAAKSAGFRVIAAGRQQIMPSALYKFGVAARFVERLFGQVYGHRLAFVFGKE